MPKTARQRLIDEYGVPPALLRQFAREAEERAEEKFAEERARLGRQSARTSDEKNLWRKKYLDAEEKRLKAEQLQAVKDATIAEQQALIEQHNATIADLRKQLFAESSERRRQQAKPPLPNEGSPEQPITSAKPKKPRGKQKGAPGYGRRMEEGLERKPVHHDTPADCCSECGLPFADCPPVISEEVDIEENIIVRQHIRKKKRRNPHCKCPKTPQFQVAPCPPKLIPAGKYSTRFWRFVIEEKFRLQRPVNRIIIKLRSLGLKKISAGTLINGLKIIHESLVLEVMYLAIIDRNRASGQWNMDETGWKIFSESEHQRSNKWYMWVSVAVDTVVFILDPRRSNEVIASHLKGVSQGIICSDRHSAYIAFGNRNEGFLIAFCWVHQRRDFIKMQTGYPKLAAWCQSWLDRIDALLQHNKVRVANLDAPEHRFENLNDILKQMVADMESEIRRQLKQKNLHEEQIARLVSMQEHWSGLTVFVENPLVPTDNNEAERALRNLVVGRKIYYGSRSVWSGEFNAQLATIYATLERNNVDPRQWMDDYLQACARNDGNPPADLQPFLPWNYKPAEPAPAIPSEPDNSRNFEPFSISLIPKPERQLVTVRPQPPPSRSF